MMPEIHLANADNETDTELNNTINYIDNISVLIEQYVENIVATNCAELDDYVNYIKSVLADDTNEIPTKVLEDITLALPTLLYQLSDISERIGVKEDISKSIKTEVYNKIVLNSTGKATENKLKAELETQSENLALIVYQRAYKTMKCKVDFGLELLQSTKKILSKRITEMELSRSVSQ